MILDQLMPNSKLKFVNFLLKNDFIKNQHVVIIGESMERGDDLEDILLRFLHRDKLLISKGLYHNSKFSVVDLMEVQDEISLDDLGLLPRQEMMDRGLAVISRDKKNIALAMVEPDDKNGVKFVEEKTGLRVTDRYVVLESDLRYILSQNRLITFYLYLKEILSEDEYHRILHLMKNVDIDSDEIFLKFIEKDELLKIKALLNNGRYDVINLMEYKEGIKEDYVNILTPEHMMNSRSMVIYFDDQQLAVAMDDPSDTKAVRYLEKVIGVPITKRYVSTFRDIRDIIRYLEEKRQIIEMEEEKIKTRRVDAPVPEIDPDYIEEDTSLVGTYDVLELTKFSLPGKSTGGIRPVLETVIKQGLIRGASDIHIEPIKGDFFKVRYRIDGILVADPKVEDILDRAREPGLLGKIVSVIKILSGESGKNMRLDVTDKHQDGRIYIKEMDLDLRIVILPSFLGESIVIRVLQRSMGEFSLDKLGFEPDTYSKFKETIEIPYGMVLVSGPTGSGKSTTLYAVLNLINSPEKKVLTIEDPVEYSIPGTVQNQINPFSGFTFEVALRAFVRSDPDIIMVGEIRDVATAAMAMESALTGHLVISSIHAKDAISTVVRLKDMGVDTRLITATCNATLAQRLVRRVCPYCKVPHKGTSKLYQALERLGIEYDDSSICKGEGCSRCFYTGYHGRIGIYEFLMMTREINELYLEDASHDTILGAARAIQGMKTLLEDALIKASRGVTSEEEVWRVTLLEGI